MTFLAWAMIILGAASIAAFIGLQMLAGFILGAITVVGASLAVGFAAASVHHRRSGEWDEWLGP